MSSILVQAISGIPCHAKEIRARQAVKDSRRKTASALAAKKIVVQSMMAVNAGLSAFAALAALAYAFQM